MSISMKRTYASWEAKPAASRKATASCWFPPSRAAQSRCECSGSASRGFRESAMPYYALFYEVRSDFIARRVPYRDEHLGLARDAHARGELVLAGALADPADGALLIFQGESPAVAEAFAQRDPYVNNGLITKWKVRNWNVVVGNTPHAKPAESA